MFPVLVMTMLSVPVVAPSALVAVRTRGFAPLSSGTTMRQRWLSSHVTSTGFRGSAGARDHDIPDVEPAAALENSARGVHREIRAAARRDLKRDSGMKCVELGEDVVAALRDPVFEVRDVGRAVSHGAEVCDDRIEVSVGEPGVAKLEQVRAEEPAVGRNLDDGGEPVASSAKDA